MNETLKFYKLCKPWRHSKNLSSSFSQWTFQHIHSLGMCFDVALYTVYRVRVGWVVYQTLHAEMDKIFFIFPPVIFQPAPPTKTSQIHLVQILEGPEDKKKVKNSKWYSFGYFFIFLQFQISGGGLGSYVGLKNRSSRFPFLG